MITKSIRNPALLEIYDDHSEAVYYGCDQEWYPTRWQRMSGCGPTAVTNLVYYRSRSLGGGEDGPVRPTKSGCLSLMQDVWRYVTPTMRGIPSTRMLCEGAAAYAEARALELELSVLDVPKERNLRPKFTELLRFLDGALRNDAPVAFLNLDNGEEKQLDSWHWVTIVSIEYAEDGRTAFVEVLDEGQIKKIDLFLWFCTTKLGGGFVRFHWDQPGPDAGGRSDGSRAEEKSV